MTHHKIVILGAGPTGLGAAHRLKELKEKDFKIYEARAYSGGLASSFQDEKGFWWDIGGHVQFSHYKYFDALMDTLLPNQWIHHQRESWVWMADRFIPYPFQLNIHRLPKEMMKECLDGLIEIHKNPLARKAKNFGEWMESTAGKGISKYFLTPYNYKVWAYPPEEMNATWVGERVAVTDLSRVFYNILENKDDLSWGPNNTFRFPNYGGTGAIWSQLAKSIGEEFFQLSAVAIQLNAKKKILTFSSGEKVSYDFLISTIPIDKLMEMSDFESATKKDAQRLKHSTTHIVGIGCEGKPSKELESKCWMYFPEDTSPFYRVTLFSKYAPANVPDNSKYFSLMTEIASSPAKKVNRKTLVDDVINGLKVTKLIKENEKIVDIWEHEESYGYPTPSVERDEILGHIQPLLMKHSILSRGRFGMWKYEVSNQDHSLMQGVEAANYVVNGDREVTAWYPDLVNSPQPYDKAA